MVAFLQGLFLLAVVHGLVVSVDAVFKRGHEIIFSFLQEIKGDVEDPFTFAVVGHASYIPLFSFAFGHDGIFSCFGFKSDGFVPCLGYLGDETCTLVVTIIEGRIVCHHLHWAHNVQVMVEGPGHVPLNQVAANMEVQKSICMGAPFYVLGPLVTDIAPGYDHITAAIGGAVAAMSGAAFLCYVTPAEHLALPNVEDVKQGIVASKIAAHAADIAKGIPHARDIDDKMGDARRVLDWDAQFACALDPETAKAIRDARLPEDDHSDTCSMCGKFCAVRSMNKALAGEYIDIL